MRLSVQAVNMDVSVSHKKGNFTRNTSYYSNCQLTNLNLIPRTVLVSAMMLVNKQVNKEHKSHDGREEVCKKWNRDKNWQNMFLIINIPIVCCTLCISDMSHIQKKSVTNQSAFHFLCQTTLFILCPWIQICGLR